MRVGFGGDMDWVNLITNLVTTGVQIGVSYDQQSKAQAAKEEEAARQAVIAAQNRAAAEANARAAQAGTVAVAGTQIDLSQVAMLGGIGVLILALVLRRK